MFGFDVIHEVLDFVPHFVCDLAIAAEKGDFDVVVSCRMALFGNIGFAEEIVDSHVEIVRELFSEWYNQLHGCRVRSLSTPDEKFREFAPYLAALDFVVF